MNPLEILSEYKFVTVYALKYVYSADADLDSVYISTRKLLDRYIDAFESDTQSLALIPGRCLLCDPCYKFLGKPCPTPEKIRYSLETLGFNLSELLNHEFDMTLSWNNNEITFIFGFAHNDPINKDFSKYINLFH
jgi:predicted metal-binding protein